MLKIFLSSHGRFASGIRSSCEILLGAQQNLTVFDAYVDNDTVQEHLDDSTKPFLLRIKSCFAAICMEAASISQCIHISRSRTRVWSAAST